jgi:hypothetical protein
MHAREFDLSVAIRILPVNGLVTLWVKPQTVLTEIYFVISGLFNICDKVLVTFTILLEFREHFKKGHPIGNVIEAKLAALKLKCREVIQ